MRQEGECGGGETRHEVRETGESKGLSRSSHQPAAKMGKVLQRQHRESLHSSYQRENKLYAVEEAGLCT